MKKTNFTFLKGLAMSALMSFGVAEANAQQFNCQNAVNVSFNADCTVSLIPATFAAGTTTATTVTIKDGTKTLASGTTAAPIVGAKAWIGKTYTFELSDASGNKCWGTVKFEDKLGPVCPAVKVSPAPAVGDGSQATPYVIACSASLEAAPYNVSPAFTDCSTWTSSYSDVVSGSLCSATGIVIERTWTAVDANGMSTSCKVWYSKQRNPAFPTIPVITYPTKANFSVCGATAALALSGSYNPGVKLTPASILPANPNFTGIGTVAFTETGYPSFAGGTIKAGSAGEDCQLSATWTDKVAATPCGITIARTWVVIDWCTGAVIAPASTNANVQVITLNDYTAPVITGASADVTINTSAANCLSNQMVPMPAASDACSAIKTTVTVGGSTFSVVAGQASIVGLPVGGPYIATWTVKDACGNTATQLQNITVKDLISPTAVADLNTKVALSQSCEAVVNAITFDDGSLDNCCLDVNSFLVKRMTPIADPALPAAPYSGNTKFDKTITFTKADCAGPVMVQFQVSDCNGNSNTAMVNVVVEDKIGPVAFGETVTVCCASNPTADAWLNAYNFKELTLTNYPSSTNPGWFDNCSAKVTPSASYGGNIDNCGRGSRTKTFTVTDAKNGMTTAATITYISENRSAYEVEFPQDVELVCVKGTVKNGYATDPVAGAGSATSPGTPQVVAYPGTCPLVGIEHTDEVFNVLPGSGENGCFKIVRTWKVLNWCQALDLNPDKETTSVPRKFRNISETRAGSAPSSAGVYTADVYAAGTPCADIMSAAKTAYNTSGGFDNDGYMEYKQIIKVTDNEAPGIIAGNVGVAPIGKECAVLVTIAAPTASDCTGVTAVSYQVLNSNNVVIASEPTFPAKSAPFPIDIKFGGTGHPFGTYTIRYIATDKCGNYASTDVTKVIGDVKKPTPICYHGLTTDLMPTSKDVWVSCGLFDAGSYDNCGPVTCYIQTPAPSAGAAVPTIAATTSRNTPNVMAPMVSFDCVGEQSVALWVRDAAGNYDFCTTYIFIQNNAGAPNVPNCTGPIAGNKVAGAVKTEAGNAATANVLFESTGAASVIKKPTTGGAYGTFYANDNTTVKVSAENDKNPLNGVSTLDLVLISKHILGTQPIASNYAQIAADVNNSGKISTADLVELRKMILGIQSNFSNNTSWKFFGANMQQLVTINNINKDETVNFTAVKIGDINGNADATLAAGRSTVNFNVADATLTAGQEVKVVMNNKEVEGFQFAMNYDAASLEVVSVDENSAVLENGTITTAQVGTEFAVTFKAKNNVQLSKAISLGSAINGEAVVNGTSANVAINFNNATSTFELAQNQPNPFRGATVVSFSTPVAGDYTMTITDMAGRAVQTINGSAVKGTNNVNVEMTSAGVFNYTVKTSNFTATKKMVVIE